MSTLAWKEWAAHQQQVYKDLKKRSSTVETTSMHSSATRKRGGPFVALQHPHTISKAVADLSFRIANIIPSTILYPSEIVHTTLGSGGKDEGYGFSPINPQDRKVLGIMTETTQKVFESKEIRRMPRCQIELSQPLWNEEAVILPGIPNETFLRVAKAIQQECSEKGIQVKLPWGAHITVARFNGTSSLEKMRLLRELLEAEPPLKNSVPDAVFIGWDSSSPQEGYNISSWFRIPI